MKRIIAATLCVIICLSLIACGDNKNEPPKINATTENTMQVKENPANEAPMVDIPEVVILDKDDVGNIAGRYVSFMDDSTVEIKLDASTSDSSAGTVVGNSTINYDQSTYSGELEKIATNVYHLKVDDADIFLCFFFETTGDSRIARLQLVFDGKDVNWYTCSEEYSYSHTSVVHSSHSF